MDERWPRRGYHYEPVGPPAANSALPLHNSALCPKPLIELPYTICYRCARTRARRKRTNRKSRALRQAFSISDGPLATNHSHYVPPLGQNSAASPKHKEPKSLFGKEKRGLGGRPHTEFWVSKIEFRKMAPKVPILRRRGDREAETIAVDGRAVATSKRECIQSSYAFSRHGSRCAVISKMLYQPGKPARIRPAPRAHPSRCSSASPAGDLCKHS